MTFDNNIIVPMSPSLAWDSEKTYLKSLIRPF